MAPPPRYQTAVLLLREVEAIWAGALVKLAMYPPAVTSPAQLRTWVRSLYHVVRSLGGADSRHDYHHHGRVLGGRELVLLALPLLRGEWGSDSGWIGWQIGVDNVRVTERGTARSYAGENPCHEIVRRVWEVMREVPGNGRPIAPRRVRNADDAIRALDVAVGWCDRMQPEAVPWGGAEVQGPRLPPPRFTPGRNRAAIWTGIPPATNTLGVLYNFPQTSDENGPAPSAASSGCAPPPSPEHPRDGPARKNQFREPGTDPYVSEEVVDEAEAIPPATPTTGIVASRVESPGDAMMGPGCLAAKYGVPQPALEKRLERWRNAHPQESGKGWIEAPDRGPRQPKYLYRVSAVLPIIEDLKASGGRRAKK
jgi:hypothetical protein